jgi:DNA mismatch repair protein MutS
MIEQYRRIKREHDGAIVFFRLGDFYEMFYEDADLASRELGIVLTARDAGEAGRAPMCGVPFHSADSYIAKLVSRGYKVAICEQVEDPRTARGLVRREVIRIVTPGTVVDDQMLDERVNNYIASIVSGLTATGLAVADVSTGDFYVMEFPGDSGVQDALLELRRVQPSECLVDSALDAAAGDAASGERAYDDDGARESVVSRAKQHCRTVEVVDHVPGEEEAAEILKRHLRVASLHGFGCESLPCAIRSAAVLLEYVKSTQKALAGQLVSLKTRVPGDSVAIDPVTRKNLELLERISDGSVEGSLVGVLDRTLTPMGARLCRQAIIKPSRLPEQINQRLDAVEELFRSVLMRRDLRDSLARIRDIERLLGRIMARTAGARELNSLASSLQPLPQIASVLRAASCRALTKMGESMPDLAEVGRLIETAISPDPPTNLKEGGLIRDGYDPAVDELRLLSKNGKGWIAGLEARERERTGIKSLKVGFNKVFGYYIEVTNAHQRLVPADYVRKQTLTGAERYVTPGLKEYEEKVLDAEERLGTLEFEVFCRVREEVALRCAAIQEAARVVAEADLVAGFAELAVSWGYVRPVVDDSKVIDIKDGRHPVVEQIIGAGDYVPNDVTLDENASRLLLVTGPNMAGKSTYARQVALITIMAQAGCFVPASFARIGCADRVFARVGASDDVSLGRSTFMVEMTEVANILNNATSRSLVILDEVGRGTGTYDGMSLAWAIAEDLSQRVSARTIMTTHYHQLTELEEALQGVRNLRVAVKERGHELTFLYKILPGSTDRSYGIHVAGLSGVPADVVERARRVLEEIEAEIFFRKARREVVSSRGRPRRDVTNQMALLLPEPVQSILASLEKADPDNMTPLEALAVLSELVRQVRGNGGAR